jgi:hypothetical protein
MPISLKIEGITKVAPTIILTLVLLQLCRVSQVQILHQIHPVKYPKKKKNTIQQSLKKMVSRKNILILAVLILKTVEPATIVSINIVGRKRKKIIYLFYTSSIYHI